MLVGRKPFFKGFRRPGIQLFRQFPRSCFSRKLKDHLRYRYGWAEQAGVVWNHSILAAAGFSRSILRIFNARHGIKERLVTDLKDPRVFFAAERTLLAWARTSLSLMAFGFVVERAGKLIRAIKADAILRGELQITLWLGVGIILLGVMTSAYSARQYGVVLRSFAAPEIPLGYMARWGLVVNLAIAGFGVLLAAALWFWRLH